MKHQLLLVLASMLCLGSILYAQKDTVEVQGYYETGQYGTLNNAIDAAKTAGNINNTVFKLKSYEVYVLSGSIYMEQGLNLEIVAPKPGNTQESAPPQIVWTEEGIDKAYIIQSLGDVTIKNVWIRFADVLGTKNSSSISFENQTDPLKQETGIFDGVIFDYNGIGSEGGGTILVKSDHFVGIFKNCYFRNQSDNHFRYYGRAVSFPYQSSGWHYDSLLFENCSFSNLGRIVMQEGNEYGTNVHINHCTLVNSLEWVFQSAGWIQNSSITNSIFLNPNILGYRALDVCNEDQDYDDFEDGLCDPPGGGLINGITAVDSFSFSVPFTDFDRKIFIGNNVYAFSQYASDWYEGCGWCQETIRNRRNEELYNPPPMLGQMEIDFIDSVDAQGNKVFQTMNVDWETIFEEDPGFVVEPTNQDTFLTFVEYKWSTAADVDWSYEPYSGFIQMWPLPENMAYANAAYQTAAMGGFPLGDLNWYPDQLASWETQRDAEWGLINNWLIYGDPDGGTSVKPVPGIVPQEYVLEQNYPNPFNPVTEIKYSVPVQGQVSLKVFNSLGQEAATLFEGVQSAGNYVATFDASGLASGVYFYRLEAGDLSMTKKLVLMK